MMAQRSIATIVFAFLKQKSFRQLAYPCGRSFAPRNQQHVNNPMNAR